MVIIGVLLYAASYEQDHSGALGIFLSLMTAVSSAYFRVMKIHHISTFTTNTFQYYVTSTTTIL